MSNPTLDQEYRAALAVFAKRHGRAWKSKLRDMWGNGQDVYEANGAKLREIRNHPSYGFEYLDRVKL